MSMMNMKLNLQMDINKCIKTPKKQRNHWSSIVIPLNKAFSLKSTNILITLLIKTFHDLHKVFYDVINTSIFILNLEDTLLKLSMITWNINGRQVDEIVRSILLNI